MTKNAGTLPTIRFETKLFTIGDFTILRLPEDASAKLPSRGQAMVEGTLNGAHFETPLEPDGNWSHYFKVDDKLLKAAGAKSGDKVAVILTPVTVWPEPEIPADLFAAIEATPEAKALWPRITTMARWEWIRWTRSTNSAETRKHRIEVACSKMKSGMRRPCCWNRNLSTEMDVSKGGILLEPTK